MAQSWRRSCRYGGCRVAEIRPSPNDRTRLRSVSPPFGRSRSKRRFWTNESMKTRPRRQQVDRCFVECGHRSKRARDQVQFVLDDKIRRIEPMPVSEGATFAWPIRAEEPLVRIIPVYVSKECAALANPWKGGKFVHRGDEKCGKTAVNWLVHHEHRQVSIPREVAFGVLAFEH